MDTHSALALLDWQIELGAGEAISDAPVNRYAGTDAPAGAVSAPVPPAAAGAAPDPVGEARRMAASAETLEDLRLALASYDHCDLKKGARTLVFADGIPEARIMIVGEAPGREEDEKGLPFVGRAGRLLDLMFDAIGMGRGHPDRDSALYIANVLPWRPPRNRDPEPEEIAMMLPFLERHVELANPSLIVLMGNHSCHALLGRKGITRLRGTWTEALGRPTLPMFHPAYLLRNPVAKREAWADLLLLQDRLRRT